jgi:hypothetical protein
MLGRSEKDKKGVNKGALEHSILLRKQKNGLYNGKSSFL